MSRVRVVTLVAVLIWSLQPSAQILNKTAPIVVSHYHLNVTSVEEHKKFWVDTGQTDFFIGADLPGVGYMLNFFRWEGDQAVTHVPTAGRVVDHVGFEVKNLEAFCKELEAKGIKLTRPYRKATPEMNDIGTAMMVDPWGVSIELTEGLDKVS